MAAKQQKKQTSENKDQRVANTQEQPTGQTQDLPPTGDDIKDDQTKGDDTTGEDDTDDAQDGDNDNLSRPSAGDFTDQPQTNAQGDVIGYGSVDAVNASTAGGVAERTKDVPRTIADVVRDAQTEHTPRAKTDAPEGRILKGDEPFTFEGEEVAGHIVLSENVYREVYPRYSKRPTYVLIGAAGSTIPVNQIQRLS